MSLRCWYWWYWFLTSLASYFTVGTSRWDAVYAFMLMLLFPLSITISNETVFVLKLIVFKIALFISTCFSSTWRQRYCVTFSDMMVVSDPLSSIALTVTVLLECFRVTGNICRNKRFEKVLEWLSITCWPSWFCWLSFCFLFLLSAVESAFLRVVYS